MAEKESRKFDIRTIENDLRDGVVSREEHAEHLANLPDVSDKAVKMESQFVEGILDEDQPGAEEETEEEE